MISGRKVSRKHQEQVWQTVQDRLRIPWCGGARRVPLDILLPIFMIPSFLMLAALGPVWTILSFTSLPLVVLYLHRNSLHLLPRTRFYLSWSISSWTFLILLFEVEVVPTLEITAKENTLFILLAVAASMCAWLTWYKAKVLEDQTSSAHHNWFLQEVDSNVQMQDKPASVSPRTYPCRICQGSVVMRDHHCIWMDCCVGQNNHGFFLLAVILFIAGTLYAANLSLTALCQPETYFSILYLPRDCSEVYENVHLSFPFVGAVYACLVVLLLLWLLVQQVVCISLGVTVCEWRRLHRQGGFASGLRAACQVHSSRRGVLANWFTFLGRRFLTNA